LPSVVVVLTWISTATEPSGDVGSGPGPECTAEEVPAGHLPAERLEAGRRQVLAHDADNGALVSRDATEYDEPEIPGDRGCATDL
jgi:hypothetical protein